MPQLSVPPAIAHVDHVVYAFPTRRSSDLASVGRASFRATLRAIPVPLLVTVTVNPMASPAETEAERAGIGLTSSDPGISSEADAVSEPTFVVVTWAVLSTGEEPAVAAVVG